MAASKAGCPALVYYTFGDKAVAELQEVCDAVIEKRWKIQDLMANVLRYCEMMNKEDFEGKLLFDVL